MLLWCCERYNLVHGQDALLIEGTNKFGFELIETIGGNDRGSKNIFISPYSIASCFSIIFPGASNLTQEEIASVLHYTTPYNQTFNTFQYYNNELESRYNGDKVSSGSNKNTFNPEILINDRIFVDDNFTLKNAYLNQVNDFIEYIDLDNTSSAVDIINAYIEDSTNNLIKDAVSNINDNTKLIAVNTVYLNGSWLRDFDPNMTSKNTFYKDASRTTVSQQIAHFMHRQGYYNYYEDSEFQYIQLYLYGNNTSNANELSVIIALPKSEQTSLSNLTYEKYQDAIDNFESTYLSLVLPKMSILYGANNLKDNLKSLGMQVPFTEFANFSEMTDEKVEITDIIHKTALNSDENGIEAVAATVLSIGITLVPRNQIIFRADHLFHVIIYDNYTNIILFMGDIATPGLPQNSVAVYDEYAHYDLWFPSEASTTTSWPTKLPAKASSVMQKIKKFFKKLGKKIKKWFS
jgi:serpin B